MDDIDRIFLSNYSQVVKNQFYQGIGRLKTSEGDLKELRRGLSLFQTL